MVSGDDLPTSQVAACGDLPLESCSKSPGVINHADTSSTHASCSVSRAQNVTTSNTIQEPALSSVNALDYVAEAPAFSYNNLQNFSSASGSQKSPVQSIHEVSNISSSTTLSYPPVHPYTSPRGPAVSSTASTVPLPPATLSGGRGTPGPPGLSSPDSCPQVAIPSASTVSAVVPRANIPAFNSMVLPQANHALVTQIYPPNFSLPPLGPSQGPWLQPELRGGLPRPAFLPYPPIFPVPIPLAPRVMPPPSIPLPNSQFPGVTPVLHVSSSSSSGNSTSQPQGSYVPQIKSHPSGDAGDDNINANKAQATSVDEVTSWTAHKTDAGVVYYYNGLTGESTYKKPTGLNGELNRIAMRSAPVSWEKLDGTDWALVSTNDGKQYYCNIKTKQSSWDIPNDVKDMGKKQDADNLKECSLLELNSIIRSEKGSVPGILGAPAASTGGRDAATLQTSCSHLATSALDLIKKKLQDPGAPATSSAAVTLGQATVDANGTRAVNSADQPKDGNGDVNLSEASSDSEDGECCPSKEQCIIQFKEMLKERGVVPFSKWEKELPKIVFDPRFKAVPGHATRRSLFERYVKTRAEEERKEKRAAQKAAVEAFKQLLVEASKDIGVTTDYHTFKRKWGGDLRFRALDRKEKEAFLNERVLILKKAAEERTHAQRSVAVSTFKSLLREKGDITANSRWSKVRDTLRSDPRYRSVHNEDREVIFNEHVAELNAAEQEAENVERAKRLEQEKLKERERELRKRKEREEQEMERVRLKVRRKEAIASYQALLVEKIKDPQASWTESKPKLEKDPQGRATTSDLDQSDIEKLFREHVKTLHERCLQDFRTLLSETITAEVANRKMDDGKTVLTSWSAAKILIKPDARYAKTSRKDREALWLQYTQDLERKSKLAGGEYEKRRNTVDFTRSSASHRYQERR